MIRFLIAFVLMPLALVGCGQTSQQKADEGNGKISRMNDIAISVASTYGVQLISYASVSTLAASNKSVISNLSTSKKKALRAQVQEFRNLAGEVLGLINSGDVTYGGDKSTIENAARNADYVLKVLATSLANAS